MSVTRITNRNLPAKSTSLKGSGSQVVDTITIEMTIATDTNTKLEYLILFNI